MGKRRFRGRQIPGIPVTSTKHNAGGDVVGMQLETGAEQLECAPDISVLPVDFGKWGEGQPLRILGIPALQLFDFSCAHRIPVVEGQHWVETTAVPAAGGT